MFSFNQRCNGPSDDAVALVICSGEPRRNTCYSSFEITSREYPPALLTANFVMASNCFDAKQGPKILKICTAGKVYRTAFPADETLSLEFLARSFPHRGQDWLLPADDSDAVVDQYIFSAVDLSRGGARTVIETDDQLNAAANEAQARGSVLRLEISGKVTSKVLAESFLKSSFTDFGNFAGGVMEGVSSLGKKVTRTAQGQVSEFLDGSYMEITKESTGPAAKSADESIGRGRKLPTGDVVSVGSLVTQANAVARKQRSAKVIQWFRDAGVGVLEGKYNELVALGFSSRDDEQIVRDITRTFPTHISYKEDGGHGQQRLRRVLNAYATHDPEVGYVQGMNFIAAYLLFHANEEDTFWILESMMRASKYGLANVFTNGMSGLHIAMYQTDRALLQVAPELHAHFESLDIAPIMWLPSWILPLFASKMSEPALESCFDRFIHGGWNEIIRISIGILIMNEERLMACTYEQCLQQLTEVLWLQKNFADMLDDVLDSTRSRVPNKDLTRWERQYLGVEADEDDSAQWMVNLIPESLGKIPAEAITSGLLLVAAGAIGLGVHLGRRLNGNGRR
jgi:hypothetical protein